MCLEPAGSIRCRRCYPLWSLLWQTRHVLYFVRIHRCIAAADENDGSAVAWLHLTGRTRSAPHRHTIWMQQLLRPQRPAAGVAQRMATQSSLQVARSSTRELLCADMRVAESYAEQRVATPPRCGARHRSAHRAADVSDKRYGRCVSCPRRANQVESIAGYGRMRVKCSAMRQVTCRFGQTRGKQTIQHRQASVSGRRSVHWLDWLRVHSLRSWYYRYVFEYITTRYMYLVHVLSTVRYNCSTATGTVL